MLQLYLAKLPFTLFFPPQDFGDKITLSSRLRNAAQGIFDGESLVLPVPQNGPPDVPRIQLESKGKTHVLQISLQRMVLEWNQRGPATAGWEESCRDYLNLLDGVLRVFCGEYAKPVRFALNPQFIHQLDASANEYLSARVIEEGRVANRPSSCKIGILDQFALNGRAMNLWMNVMSARQQNNPADDRGLIIHFDFNSAQEDTRPLSADDILMILNEGPALMAERLRTFFSDLAGPAAPE